MSRAVGAAPVWDLHTHLFPPEFGTPMGRGVTPDPHGLMLWGVDELVTYHYLIAEVLREAPEVTPEAFYARSRSEQADLIWQKLFVDATPVSEACRGVVTTLTKLGLDPNEKSLAGHRRWFAEQTPAGQVDRVLELAGVDTVTMTNDVFDENERGRWLAEGGVARDPRFPAVLRFDPLVVDWPAAAPRLRDWGYAVDAQASAGSIDAVRRFLGEWIGRMKPVYCAMSLPPEWRYPADGPGNRVLAEAIVPACSEHGLPLALMIGVTRGVNPALRQAGDGIGVTHVDSLAALCRDFPQQRIMATLLARENQHALAVAARKFSNLTPFGCWWFINTPSLIEETTRMRLELLGPTFVPQHSDARVLEQLLYKWDHSRAVLAKVLTDKYQDLAAAGWRVTPAAIERDANRLLRGNVATLLEQ
ncbi:glucuronate isomerase [Pirellulimonas nuda]|uniref:glucuronate isomerase n=1 Tax=Pirellulimonas nuda TaxID=2528009 RepID=UPI00119F7193|nr:glucuronate isomerase [Pirellulimonas nuda]